MDVENPAADHRLMLTPVRRVEVVVDISHAHNRVRVGARSNITFLVQMPQHQSVTLFLMQRDHE